MEKTTLQTFDILQFQHDLLKWYDKNKRDLPWRKDKNPYKIWVSEIMLQQTQVATVIPYFYRFLEKFPTVYDLAAANEQDVLKAWEGLGYYSRARNLQNAVQEVVAEYNGKVPDNPDQLGGLKGIGPYTRGAILSIAFDQPEPAVDGNVMRVLSRVLKIEEDITQAPVKKNFEMYVRQLIDKDDPSSFNQAIMELGALICTPKSPKCMQCPVNEYCKAYAAGVEQDLPIKAKAKKKKTIPYVVLLIKNEHEQVVVEKRPEKGLLGNLWQFPMVPIDEIGMDHLESWMQVEYGLKLKLLHKKGKIKHVFTHIIWQLDIYEAVTSENDIDDTRIRFIRKDDLKEYPFPVSHQKMMKYL